MPGALGDLECGYEPLLTVDRRDGAVAVAAAPAEEKEERHEHNTLTDPRFRIKMALELFALYLVAYYVDVSLDFMALWNFFDAGMFWFFSINLAAILMTLFFTFTELVGVLRDYALSPLENLVLGMSYMVHMHVFVIVFISLRNLKIHPMLTSAKFAEAGIEAATSAAIQLYSIMFCNDELPFATCSFTSDQQHTMMLSVLSSSASISVAFAMFDLGDYGASGFPGSITAKLSWRYVLILTFRFAEVASRLLTTAFFHFVTRPNGGFVAALVDFTCIALLIWWYQGYHRYVFPCMFCLVNPLFESSNVLSIPANVYYAYRVLSLVGFVVVAVSYNPSNIHLAWTTYPLRPLCIVAIFMTLLWMLLLPVIRLLAHPSMENPNYQWGAMPFTPVQRRMRDRMLKEKGELANIWLRIYRDQLRGFLSLLFQASKGGDEDEGARLEASMTSLLHYQHNMLDDCQAEVASGASKDMALELAVEFPRLLLCRPHDLGSVLFLSLNAALRDRHESVLNVLVENKVGARVFTRYVSAVLYRYADSKPERFVAEAAGGGDASSAARTGDVHVLCSKGHKMHDVEAIFGKDEDNPDCDLCGRDAEGAKLWACFMCQEYFCDSCYCTREEELKAELQDVLLDFSNEEVEMTWLIQLTNAMMKALGKSGAKGLLGGAGGCPLHASLSFLRDLMPFDSKAQLWERRQDPRIRVGLEILAPLVRRQATKPLSEMRLKDKMTLLDEMVAHDGASVLDMLPYLPPAVEVADKHLRQQVLSKLATLLMQCANETHWQIDVFAMRLIVDYAVSVSKEVIEKNRTLHNTLQRILSIAKNSSSAPVRTEALVLESVLPSGSHPLLGLEPWCEALRNLRAQAEKLKLDAHGEAYAKNAFATALPEIERLLGQDPNSIVVNPCVNGYIALAAHMLQSLSFWSTFDSFQQVSDNLKNEFISILTRAAALAAQSEESIWGDAVLTRVLSMVNAILAEGCSSQQWEPQVREKLVKRLWQAVEPAVRPDDERLHVLGLLQICNRGLHSSGSAPADHMSKLIGDSQWQTLYTLLPALDWKAHEVCEKGHGLERVEGCFACDARRGSERKKHADDGHTMFMGCHKCEYHLCQKCCDYDTEAQRALVLSAVQEQRSYRPPGGDYPTLLDRALPYIARASKPVLLEHASALLRLKEVADGDLHGTPKKLLAQVMRKLAPIGAVMPGLETFSIKVVRQPPAFDKELIKENDIVTMADVLRMRKPVVCTLNECAVDSCDSLASSCAQNEFIFFILNADFDSDDGVDDDDSDKDAEKEQTDEEEADEEDSDKDDSDKEARTWPQGSRRLAAQLLDVREEDLISYPTSPAKFFRHEESGNERVRRRSARDDATVEGSLVNKAAYKQLRTLGITESFVLSPEGVLMARDRHPTNMLAIARQLTTRARPA